LSNQKLEYLSEKRDSLFLCLEDADQRFKIGIAKMQEIKDRVDELEELRTLSLRQNFIKSEIEKTNNSFLIDMLKNELSLIKSDNRYDQTYCEVVIGYKSMSRRKNVLEEERNSIVKDIEKINEELKK